MNNYISTCSNFTVDDFINYLSVHRGIITCIGVATVVILMTKTSTLLEPSFLDGISAIEQAADLSKSKKDHWICSLRQIGKWLDRPLQLIPARWTSIRLPATQLHHARLDVTAKTLANHRANVVAALRWYGKEYSAGARGAIVGRMGGAA